MSNSLRENKLTNLAIIRLKRLGFTNVDTQTLLEDEVYRSYFMKMLKDISNRKKNWKGTIDTILKEIDKKGLSE
ncbi:MAG: hypothetical protein R6U03_04945 [Gillisia sp.]